MHLIGREELISKGQYHSVCEIHFDAEDVQVNAKRKLLKKTAIPRFHLPVIEKQDKETQCDALTTWSVSTQTNESDIFSAEVKEEINVEVKEEIIDPDYLSETATLFSADTTRKRKLIDIPICEDSDVKKISISQDCTQ